MIEPASPHTESPSNFYFNLMCVHFRELRLAVIIPLESLEILLKEAVTRSGSWDNKHLRSVQALKEVHSSRNFSVSTARAIGCVKLSF